MLEPDPVEIERNRDIDESHESREHQWDDAWPSPQEGGHPNLPGEVDVDDEVTPYPGVAGTYSAEESVRDAEPYVPPIDPPVLPGGDEGVHVATGFGLSPDEEAAAGGEMRGDFDIEDEVRRALRQDSLTSRYDLHVAVQDGFVRLRGAVPSIDDGEHAMSIAGEIPGVVDVIDDMMIDSSMAP